MITAATGPRRVRQSLAFRKGFGRTKHERLCRVFGLLGTFEHTPITRQFDALNELEIDCARARTSKVWDVLHECRDILCELAKVTP